MVNRKIVCLGGGIGTVNLVKGLIKHTEQITVVASVADDGGSGGRLRRLYRIPPPGDYISFVAAMSGLSKTAKDMLVYRFAGDRYGKDESLGGHKLGNLMLAALATITGDFSKALKQMQGIFKTKGEILPATNKAVSIWAETSVGEKVYREENIDLGRFTGTIEKLHIAPENPPVSREVIKAIEGADLIIAGPGDLYSTILPVLLIPKILDSVKNSKAKKLYVVNVANKQFETPKYRASDYMTAIERHCGTSIFNKVLINDNINLKIPEKYQRQYELVPLNYKKGKYSVIASDIIDASFPLYHDSDKLAKVIIEKI